jgi:hypothetical protein
MDPMAALIFINLIELNFMIIVPETQKRGSAMAHQ